MPTFRKRIAFGREDSTAIEPHVIPIFKTMDKIQDLNGYLNINNALLIIKIHPMQDLSSIKLHDYSNIKVLNGHSVKKLGGDNDRLMKDENNKDPYQEKRHEIFDKSYKFYDGNSCQRLAELLKL